MPGVTVNCAQLAILKGSAARALLIRARGPASFGVVARERGLVHERVAPAQAVARDAQAGGIVNELHLEGVGHSPHLESPIEFRRALLTAIGYVGTPADPSPPTEAIIIRSAD